jgi:DnaJ-class molecular chaperone
MSAVAAGTATRVGRGPLPAAARARRRQAASSMAFDAIFDRPADGQTFDDVIVGAWEDLSAHRTVTCPVCHGAAMRPRYGGGQGAVGGRCADCGTVLG